MARLLYAILQTKYVIFNETHGVSRAPFGFYTANNIITIIVYTCICDLFECECSSTTTISAFSSE